MLNGLHTSASDSHPHTESTAQRATWAPDLRGSKGRYFQTSQHMLIANPGMPQTRAPGILFLFVSMENVVYLAQPDRSNARSFRATSSHHHATCLCLRSLQSWLMLRAAARHDASHDHGRSPQTLTLVSTQLAGPPPACSAPTEPPTRFPKRHHAGAAVADHPPGAAHQREPTASPAAAGRQVAGQDGGNATPQLRTLQGGSPISSVGVCECSSTGTGATHGEAVCR